jgi:hypothetical protein
MISYNNNNSNEHTLHVTYHITIIKINKKCHMVLTMVQTCHNLNIGSTTKCEVQGPMRSKMFLGVKHTFTSGWECKGWSPMTPKCTPTLGITLVHELWMFKILVGKSTSTKLSPHDTIRKVLKHTCLKCPCIGHLVMICMN